MTLRLVYIAAHIEPVQTGGEQYNLHLIAAAERAGIHVVRLGLSDNPLHRWLNETRGLWRLCRPFAFLWSQWMMFRYGRETLLFDAWLAPLLWPGIVMLRRRYLVIVHHLCADMQVGWRKRWLSFAEARLLRYAKRVLTVSQSSKRQVESKTQGLIPVNVINTAFQPVEGISRGGGEVLRILYVGHITRAKGVLDLAMAAAGLPRDGSWRLDMVGRDNVEPDTTAKIRHICHEAGIGERVTMYGRLADDELLALYLSSDIFVLPSHWEGYGIVLLEAMSHRLAVVSTTAGAIPEVVADGETGLLVAPGDVAALAKAIVRLIQDKRLRNRLAANGQSFAQRHPNWEGMEETCMAWWRDVRADLGDVA